MAKRRGSDAVKGALGDLLRHTGKAQQDDEREASGVTVSAYVPKEISEFYQELAVQYFGDKLSPALTYALTFFAKEYKAGRVSFEFERTLKMLSIDE